MTIDPYRLIFLKLCSDLAAHSNNDIHCCLGYCGLTATRKPYSLLASLPISPSLQRATVGELLSDASAPLQSAFLTAVVNGVCSRLFQKVQSIIVFLILK